MITLIATMLVGQGIFVGPTYPYPLRPSALNSDIEAQYLQWMWTPPAPMIPSPRMKTITLRRGLQPTGRIVRIDQGKREITLQLPVGTRTIKVDERMGIFSLDGSFPELKVGQLVNATAHAITILQAVPAPASFPLSASDLGKGKAN